MMIWPVVPICKKQQRDVRESDILECGRYRICDTSRAGNGNDPLPTIIEEEFAFRNLTRQFVVQLQGCPLKCPYCYVTPDGVHGCAIGLTSEQIVDDFKKSGCNVFHLMGGAPGMYIDDWFDIIIHLPPTAIFHSDLLLIEKKYDERTIEELCRYDRTLYAVNIKGTTDEEFLSNTGVKMTVALADRMWDNFKTIIRCSNPYKFYFTFTNCNHNAVEDFKRNVIRSFPEEARLLHYLFGKRSYELPLKQYKALED